MTFGTPVIRRGEQRDVDRLVMLINRAFEVEAFFVVGDRTTAAQVQDKLRSGVFFVMEQRDRVVGCVHAEHGEAGRAYIGMLAVDPSIQKQGIGRQLMRVAEQHCRQAHCHEVLLTVINLRTELPPFYRSLGYRETGTAPYTDAHRATQPVHFIVMRKVLTRERAAP